MKEGKSMERAAEDIRVWNAIDGELVEFDKLDEVLPWLKENFTDIEEGIHPDIESIEIFKLIANVVVNHNEEKNTYSLKVRPIAGWQEQDKEIERLKILLKTEFIKRNHGKKLGEIDSDWQQFKTENNL